MRSVAVNVEISDLNIDSNADQGPITIGGFDVSTFSRVVTFRTVVNSRQVT